MLISAEDKLDVPLPTLGVTPTELRTLQFSNYQLPEFLRIAAGFGTEKFAFVVTPNTDHVIRYYDDPAFRECYRRAEFVMLDSRFLAHIMRFLFSMRVTACPGSDLTEQLLGQVVAPHDKLVVVGGSEAQMQLLNQKYGLQGVRHYNPPMGFIDDPAEVEACLHFIESESPFRFCLLAVGSPQQELLAQALHIRSRARGLLLCVGASINFVTGAERRAPTWLQNLGFEWLYRLLRDPKRLAKRYLLRGPRIFFLMSRLKFVATPQVQ